MFAICNYKNVPKGIEKFAQDVQHFAKYYIDSQTIDKYF